MQYDAVVIPEVRNLCGDKTWPLLRSISLSFMFGGHFYFT